MTIKYLTLLEKNPIIDGFSDIGVPLSVIEAYEQQYQIKFPKAYKEFLYLAGDSSNVLDGINGGGFPDYKSEQQLYTKKLLKEEGLQIPGGDFWVISDTDGGEQFDFFYFNDPTAEDPENPPVYNSCPGILEEKYPLKRLAAKSFSEWIDGFVNRFKPKDN